MSDTYDRCPKCHEYAWLRSHTCRQFECRNPAEDGDDWTTQHGFDAEEAATNFAERRDDERSMVGGRAKTIEVRDGKRVRMFTVTAEAEVVYTANELKDEST